MPLSCKGIVIHSLRFLTDKHTHKLIHTHSNTHKHAHNVTLPSLLLLLLVPAVASACSDVVHRSSRAASQWSEAMVLTNTHTHTTDPSLPLSSHSLTLTLPLCLLLPLCVPVSEPAQKACVCGGECVRAASSLG